MFPIRLVQKSSSVPTILLTRPSCGYQDNLAVQSVTMNVSEEIIVYIKTKDRAAYEPLPLNVGFIHITVI
jgi:hypothetical protein